MLGGLVISLGLGSIILIYFSVSFMLISLDFQFYSMKNHAFEIANTESSQ